MTTIDRRSLLKVAATALAVPFVGIRSSRAQAAATGPLRFMCIIDPYGFHGDRDTNWVRNGALDYQLTGDDLGLFLEPLARHASLMTILSGTTQMSRSQLGGGASHSDIDKHALTGSRGWAGRGDGRHGHASIDAHIGHFLGQAAASQNRSRVYETVVTGAGAFLQGGETSYSFDTQGVRILPTRFAANIYSRVFATSSELGGLDRLLSQKAVMEQVTEQIATIRPQLVQANSATVLDAYHTSVDQVARGLALRIEQACEVEVPQLARSSDEQNVEGLFDATYDLFSCDLASTVTFGHPRLMRHRVLAQSAGAASGMVNSSFHSYSHGLTDAHTLAQSVVWRWRFERLANLVDRLIATPDVDGVSSLMDNTVIFFTSSMSANTHQTTQPYGTFLLGGRNSNLRSGWHLNCAGRSNNEVLTTVAQAVRSPVLSFGGLNLSYESAAAQLINRGPIEAALQQVYI